LFLTYYPYDDIYDDIILSNNQCVICLETLDDFGEFPINLENEKIRTKYYLSCDCNVFVHKTCIFLYYDKSNKCIICNKEIVLRNVKNITINSIVFINILIYCRAILMAFLFIILLSFKLYVIVWKHLIIKKF